MGDVKVLTISLQPVRHASPGSTGFSAAPRFGNAAVASAVSVVAGPVTQSAWRKAFQFLTSRETFYRFWTEILGAIVSGMFLLASARMRLKDVAPAPGPSLQSQAAMQPMLRRVVRVGTTSRARRAGYLA